MQVTEQILCTLEVVGDREIEDAGRVLGYLPKRKVRPRLRIGRVLLVAAIFAALFSVTAYAAGWFGLSARLTEAKDTTPYADESGLTHYISFNDYARSPAAKAHAEWHAFWWDYIQDRQFDTAAELAWEKQIGEEQTAIAHIYGCCDQTMLDKLYSIRDQYDVRLHTQMVTPKDDKTFFELTGLEPFAAAGTELQIQYVYEDGSFKGEGRTELDGLDCWFTLVRGAKGALDPASNTEDRAEEYEEWTCTTAKGAEVTVALGPVPTREEELSQSEHRACYLFYDSPDYVVTVLGSVPNTENAKACVEELADRFDFASLCGGKTDLSPVTEAKPRMVEPKEDLMTLQDWVNTDEYKASSEFRRSFCAYAENLEENKDRPRGMSIYNYYGSFPSQIPEVQAMAEQIEQDYDLVMPHKVRAVLGGGEVDPDSVTADMGHRTPDGEAWDYGWQKRSQEECLEMLGIQPFTQTGEIFHLFRYDNGAFFCNITSGPSGYDLHYIPKGAFYPLFRFVLHPELEGWAYDSACGEQVYLVQGGETEYPNTGFPYIFYETDTAYVIVECYASDDAYTLQSVADDIDFTVFP